MSELTKGELVFAGVFAVALASVVWFMAVHHTAPPVYKTGTYCSADKKFCWSVKEAAPCSPTSNYQFGFGGSVLEGELERCI